MPTQTILQSVQVNVPAMQVNTIVLYSSSVKEAFVIGKNGFSMAKSNLIIQTTLSGQDGDDTGNSVCLPNAVHMTRQWLMNSRKLK